MATTPALFTTGSPLLSLNTPHLMVVSVKRSNDHPQLSMRLGWDAESRKYLPISIDIADPVAALTVTRAKKTPIQRIALPAIKDALAQNNPDLLDLNGPKRYLKSQKGRKASDRRRFKPTHSDLVEGAYVYLLARAARDFPLVAMAQAMGISHTDAKYWQRWAKKAELLPR